MTDFSSSVRWTSGAAILGLLALAAGCGSNVTGSGSGSGAGGAGAAGGAGSTGGIGGGQGGETSSGSVGGNGGAGPTASAVSSVTSVTTGVGASGGTGGSGGSAYADCKSCRNDTPNAGAKAEECKDAGMACYGNKLCVSLFNCVYQGTVDGGGNPIGACDTSAAGACCTFQCYDHIKKLAGGPAADVIALYEAVDQCTTCDVCEGICNATAYCDAYALGAGQCSPN